MSRPLQVYLEEQDFELLEDWAARNSWTKSQAIRVALRSAARPPAGDALLDAAGMVDGLPADVSGHVDRYLAETYVAEPSARYGRGRRPRVRR